MSSHISPHAHTVCIVVEDNSQHLAAANLAQSLDLKLLDAKAAALFPYQLHFTIHGLELQAFHTQGKSRLTAEFVKGPIGYRRKHGGGYRQAIAKAVGIKNAKQLLSVLDATAGLGRDAFILAYLGCHVHLVERSPIIAALLKDGLARAEQEPTLSNILRERMFVSVGDAQDILASIEHNTLRYERPDVVYLDPMFPEENKTALATVDLRIIRDIVGPDLDAESLFKVALSVAKQRVVVKRPVHAPTISALKPSFILVGKSNRYDVYIRHGSN